MARDERLKSQHGLIVCLLETCRGVLRRHVDGTVGSTPNGKGAILMADWGFRFTPENADDLDPLVDALTEVITYAPDERDDESARWETKSGLFDLDIAPVLKSLKFSGEVLSDGEASGQGVQEWTYEAGERTSIFDVDND